MSLRTKPTKHQKLYMSTGNFSSTSLGSYSIPKMSTGSALPITAVTVNKSLLTPLNIDIDPTIQAVRNQEKEQIKGLNNRFAAYIDKVRFLEQQNKMLETKWNLLQSQTAATSNIEPMLKSYIASLQRQLEIIQNGRHKLDMENMSMHNQVEEYKTQYEKEINTRNEAENQFVLLKKDVDTGYMSKMELEDSVSIISDEVAFFKSLYDTEIRELQNSLKETSVVVEMDNARGLNMDQIVADVKAQYEGIAARSREEAESWYKTKFDQVSAEANQYGNELHSSKAAITELKRMISRLRNEIEAAKAQRASVESQINEAEECGEKAVKDARDRIRELEMALQKAKQDMARQVKEYQELMNLKLALDIEISTYKKLLEGEEARLGCDSIVNIQTVPGKTVSTTKHQRQKSGPLYIKTVETSDRSYN